MIVLAEDCPGCILAAEIMRKAADTLAGTAGAVVGAGLGGLMTARTGDPSWVARGRVAGAVVAPKLVEETALGIRDKLKRTKKQKARDKKLSKAMKTANGMGRKKNGEWKKGWDNSRVMTTAHRMCK